MIENHSTYSGSLTFNYYLCSMSQPFPYYYRAYGLNIASNIPVIGFTECAVTEPDVTITEGDVPENLESITSKSGPFQSGDHELLFRHQPVGAFYIANGNQIVIQKAAGVKESDLSTVIVGICFGAILHQRMLLPLHASAVCFRNKCIVLAGRSGAGKTTLAAAFIKAGASLIADDVSLIKFEDEIPVVMPAFPTIKIWSDSLQHFGISSEGLLAVRDEMQKYYLPVDQFQVVPAPADHIIILDTHSNPEIEFQSMNGYEKFFELRKYTYLHKSFSGNDYLTNHFQLAGKLASKVPVHKLIRPKDNFDTDQLIHIISKHIGINKGKAL